MEPWLWAVIAKPLVCAAVAFLICAPTRYLAMRYLPEGRVKRILLLRISK